MRSFLKVIRSLRGLDLLVVEEQMRATWLGFLLVPILLVAPWTCLAEEFAGRLVRVDLPGMKIDDYGPALDLVDA